MDRVASLTGFAADLAGFLGALYAIDPRGGPPPGTHNFFRGASGDTYDTQTRKSIQLLADKINAETATEVWEAALVPAFCRTSRNHARRDEFRLARPSISSSSRRAGHVRQGGK